MKTNNKQIRNMEVKRNLYVCMENALVFCPLFIGLILTLVGMLFNAYIYSVVGIIVMTLGTPCGLIIADLIKGKTDKLLDEMTDMEIVMEVEELIDNATCIEDLLPYKNKIRKAFEISKIAHFEDILEDMSNL